jgi:DNA-binding transcriptional ArsR family regulator
MNEKEKFEMVRKMAEVYKAMGDVNRLIIINILASREVDKVCVTDLAKMLGITQPAASQHLKVLRHIGILDARKEGNYTYYTFNREVMEQLKKNNDYLFQAAFEKCDRTAGECPL